MIYDYIDGVLDRLTAEGNFRTLPEGAGNGMADFTTNDYLGIAQRQDFTEEFMSTAFTNFRESFTNHLTPFTSSASRLLCGHPSEHILLERRLSELYGGRAALLFNSGYHANTGLIAALGSLHSTMIVADKLVHASIIDGMKLAGAPSRRFAHNNFEHLARILEKEAKEFDNIIVVVESVYSMDGDRTDLDALLSIKRRYPGVMLYVDEAHAVGVCGRGGLGLCCSHPDFEDIDIVIGTMGKALASTGAYCICSERMRQFAVNRCRSLIFSTALAPVSCAWSRFVLDKVVGMDTERERLGRISAAVSVATGLREPSHIVPVIAGSSAKAMEWSARLAEQGLKVLPIRTPTVPPGTERLRISLSAAMSDQSVSTLIKALESLR